MNKRQRKKEEKILFLGTRQMRWAFWGNHRYAHWAYAHRGQHPTAALWVEMHEREVRYALLDHPRRRWLTVRAFAERSAAILQDIAADEAASQQRPRTQDAPLAEWLKKHPV